MSDHDNSIKRQYCTLILLSDLCHHLSRVYITFEMRRNSQQNPESTKSKLIQCCFCIPGVNPRARDARNILVSQHKAGPLSVREISNCCQTGSLLVGQHCLPYSQHSHIHTQTWHYPKPSHKPTMCFEDIVHPYNCTSSCETHTLSDTLTPSSWTPKATFTSTSLFFASQNHLRQTFNLMLLQIQLNCSVVFVFTCNSMCV